MILYLVEVLIDGRREFQTCGLYTVKEEACAAGMEQFNFGLPMITAWVEGEYNYAYVEPGSGDLFDYDVSGARVPVDLVPFSEQKEEEVVDGPSVWVDD